MSLAPKHCVEAGSRSNRRCAGSKLRMVIFSSETPAGFFLPPQRIQQFKGALGEAELVLSVSWALLANRRESFEMLAIVKRDAASLNLLLPKTKKIFCKGHTFEYMQSRSFNHGQRATWHVAASMKASISASNQSARLSGLSPRGSHWRVAKVAHRCGLGQNSAPTDHGMLRSRLFGILSQFAGSTPTATSKSASSVVYANSKSLLRLNRVRSVEKLDAVRLSQGHSVVEPSHPGIFVRATHSSVPRQRHSLAPP